MDALAEHKLISDMVAAAYRDVPAGLPNQFLEIGAYDGGDQSPARPLLNAGWTGAYVEPHAANFLRLQANVGDRPGITLVNAALATRSGPVRFFDDGGGQVSSVDLDHVRAFQDAGTDYTSYLVAGITPQALIDALNGPGGWRMLNIDAEGLSVDLLRLFPLRQMDELDMIVIEHDRRAPEVAGLLDPLGYSLKLEEQYNSVWVRGVALENLIDAWPEVQS